MKIEHKISIAMESALTVGELIAQLGMPPSHAHVTVRVSGSNTSPDPREYQETFLEISWSTESAADALSGRRSS